MEPFRDVVTLTDIKKLTRAGTRSNVYDRRIQEIPQT